MKRRNTTEEQSVIHSTFVIERSYPAKPERVFAAFADPAKKRRWFAEAFFEGADGPEMREEGWRKLFEQLTEELPR